MMRTRLIVPDSLQAEADGFSLAIRLPWYRSLPLSVIDLPKLMLDGVAIDPDAIRVEVNHKNYAGPALADATQEWWYVLDPGTLHVAGAPLAPGRDHEVAVDVSFAPPYFDLVLHCAATRGMTARGGRGLR